jgi:hypothetical protein
MPYKTKAESERENWMTLPEAVTHILSADKCDDLSAARRQLRAALADGALKPLRWKRESDDRSPPFGSTSVITPSETPPLGRDWLNAKIRWRMGRVRDDWDEFKNGKWRVLLIHGHSLARHWPKHVRTGPSKHAGGTRVSAKVIDLSARKGGGRPTARSQVYNELHKMRDSGWDMSLPQKTLAEEVAKRNDKKLGERNWDERTIIEHVSRWLHDNGLV